MPSGPPPENRTENAMMVSTDISVISNTPSTLAVRLISKYARVAFRISMRIANTCHGISSPSWASNVLCPKEEKIPMSEASNTM